MTVTSLETAVDYGFVLAVLNTTSGEVRPLTGPDRQSWLNLHGHVTAVEPPPPSASTVENHVRLAPISNVPRRQRTLARRALFRARLARLGGGFNLGCGLSLGYGRRLGLMCGGLSGQLRLVRDARRRAPRPATLADASAAVDAVRAVAPLAPFEVRPIDEAIAALLLLRSSGLSATFRYGVTVDPIQVHSWLEIDGNPIDQPAWISRYTPFP